MMKWKIELRTSNNPAAWTNQRINTVYDSTDISIDITGTKCCIVIDGDTNNRDIFNNLWELLFLYDGYFYIP